MSAPIPTVRPAVTTADYDTVALLMRRYVDGLAFTLDFQDFESEVAGIREGYASPLGAAFLAFVGAEPVGTVAVRIIGDDTAEMKRMYVQPEGRGHGLGRLLGLHAIAAARRLGAGRMVLDTDPPSMAAANRLYESLGFVDVAAYRHNPLPCARFMALDLNAATPAPIGVIAAGGAGRRMGADKALVEIAGEPMVALVAAALIEAGLEPSVVGRDHAVDGVPAVPDPPGLAGPAAALAAAFRTRPGADVVLVATDQPYLRPETVRQLLGMPGPAVVPVDVRRQSLCAVYRDVCALELERLLAERPNASLQTLLDTLATVEVPPEQWRTWGEDGRSWLSVDTPDTLEAVRGSWPASPRLPPPAP